MDLDLDLSSAPRGKPDLTGSLVRELTNADLLIAEAAPKGVVTNHVQKLNDRHHALARTLASGVDHITASIITGYRQVTISILLGDPSFKELVEFYRANLDVVYADLHARMSVLSQTVLNEIAERFEGNPASMSNGFLHDLFKTLTDRTGFGPRTTQVNVNVDLAGRLSAARRRAAEGEGVEPRRALPITIEAQGVPK